MGFAYLGAILVSACGTGILDRRWHLALFRRPLFTGMAVLGMLVFFLVWDLVGISTGVFLRGETPYMTGVLLAPELPLEEPFFLAFLAYVTLVTVGAVDRILTAAGERS